MRSEEEHRLQWGTEISRDEISRDLYYVSKVQIEGSEYVPLCAELGDRDKAGEKSGNLEETSGEAGREAGIQEHIDHWKKL